VHPLTLELADCCMADHAAGFIFFFSQVDHASFVEPGGNGLKNPNHYTSDS
jgi:hypothetical protein